MRLLDKKRNIIVDVEDSLVNDALQSGNYEIRPGVPVPVTYADGSQGTVLSDDMPSAVMDGVRYRTAQEDRAKGEQQIEEIKKEAYDKPGVAFTMGALRGATLGASDLAFRGVAELTGNEGALEAAREVAERSPTASLAGEITGGVASFVTPTGAAGALTRVAGAPTRLLAKGAEKVGAKVAGKVAAEGSTLGKLVNSAAAGAVEGAAIGLGQTVTEAALDDPELTMQKALGNVGLGAILGGSLSGATRGAFEGARFGVTGALEKLSQSKLVPKTAEQAGGLLAQAYGKAQKMFGGDFAPTQESMRVYAPTAEGRQLRKEVVNHLKDPQSMYRRVADNFDDVMKFSDELEEITGEAAAIQKGVLDAEIGKVDKRTIARLDDWSDDIETAEGIGLEEFLEAPEIKGTRLEKAEKTAGFQKFDKAEAAARNLVDTMDKVRSEMVAENAKFGQVYSGPALAQLSKITEELSTTIAKTRKASVINDAIVKAKAELAENTALFAKNLEFLKETNPVQYATIQKLRPVWGKLREASRDTDLFGELGAAVADRADNLTKLKQGVRDFDKFFFEHRKVGGRFERVEDYTKIANFLKNVDGTAKEKQRIALQEFRDNTREVIEALKPIDKKPLSDELARLQKLRAQTEKGIVNKKQLANKERSLEFLDGRIKNLEEQAKRIDKFNVTIKDTIQSSKARLNSFEKAFDISKDVREAALEIQRLESTTGRSLLGGGVLGATTSILGTAGADLGVVSGPAGFLLGAALSNPKTAMKFIVALEDAANGFDRMAQNAAKRFKNLDYAQQVKKGITGKAGPALRQSLIRDRLKMEPGERHEDDEKAFKSHRKKLGELQRDPEMLFDRVIDSLGMEAVKQNPRISIEAYTSIQRGLSFLESKIPKDPYAPGMYPDDFTPSKVEMSQYADFVQAVMKPKTIVKQIEAGVINPRTVEAVKTVYPAMFESLKAQVAEELTTTNKIDYLKRVQLGVLFEVPSVKALQPDYMRRLMSLTSGAQEQGDESQRVGQGATMNRTQMVGFREMKISERQQRV